MAKVVFVQNIWFEFQGPMYVSALLKSRGHECDLLIVDDESRAVAELTALKPDIVAFSIMTGSHRWASRFGAQVKSHLSCLTVFGGPHPTFFPEYIEENGVDAICRGEGEYPLLELADAVEIKADYAYLQNFWFKMPDGSIQKNDVRELIQELDSLPFPDRRLYRRYPSLESSVAVFISSRGCPFDCSFCFNHQMMELYRGKGKYVRHRSPASLIEEITAVTRSRTVKRIYFSDDTFALDKKWLKEFLPAYGREIAIPFHCLARINQIDDETASLLSVNGCATIFWGIESGDENIRMNILEKGITDEHIINGAQTLKRHGIRFRTYNIVGFPGETLAQTLKTVELNIKIDTDYPWCSIFMPYPGTRLAKYAREQGFLASDVTPDSMTSSFFIGSVINSREQNQIVNLHKFFQTVVLFPFLLPLVLLLIRLPANRLFQAWFAFVYFILYVRSEGRSFWETLSQAVKNSGQFRKRS